MVYQKSFFYTIDRLMASIEVCPCIVNQNIQPRESFVELICKLSHLMKIAKICHKKVNQLITSLCANLLSNVLHFHGISPNEDHLISLGGKDHCGGFSNPRGCPCN